jgi:hypothetical protein
LSAIFNGNEEPRIGLGSPFWAYSITPMLILGKLGALAWHLFSSDLRFANCVNVSRFVWFFLFIDLGTVGWLNLFESVLQLSSASLLLISNSRLPQFEQYLNDSCMKEPQSEHYIFKSLSFKYWRGVNGGKSWTKISAIRQKYQ